MFPPDDDLIYHDKRIKEARASGKMHCIDKSMGILKDYDGDAANELNIVFERCDNQTRSDCKNYEEWREEQGPIFKIYSTKLLVNWM